MSKFDVAMPIMAEEPYTSLSGLISQKCRKPELRGEFPRHTALPTLKESTKSVTCKCKPTKKPLLSYNLPPGWWKSIPLPLLPSLTLEVSVISPPSKFQSKASLPTDISPQSHESSCEKSDTWPRQVYLTIWLLDCVPAQLQKLFRPWTYPSNPSI